ncbi:MAG: nitroreductase family deazaflavin-dependent oxidoreductase [Anaerolineae bacterium]|nr:nitroreductase family deazaflavin-dependent oxidoreductase [Anaerolineae bacterium]
MAMKPAQWMKGAFKVANNLHVALYRKSGGKLGNTIVGMPVLLITTFGRRSGKPKTNPVAFIQEGQDYLVSATSGGSDWHPDWYLNLKARPDAKIELGGKTLDVHATIAQGEERARLYDRFKAASSNFVKYEQNTSRVIPVLRLIPIELEQKEA